MRKKSIEKMGSRIIGLVLTAALLAGCSGGGASGETSASSEQAAVAETTDGSAQSTAEGETGGAASASGDAYTLPIGDGETDNLTVACLEGWYTAVSINDNLEIWQETENRTGVKINWEASADYDTVMQPRIAAGSDLPDIFVVPPSMTNTGVYNLAQEGLIQPLDDLISQYAPDIQRVLDEDPELKNLLTAPDGHIYTIADTPKYVNDMVVANALFIRQDWMDTLGLEQPETIEDWYEVLTAFKNEDPNGNGIQDEIPLSGIDLASGLFSYLLSAYDLPAGVGPWWYDENGEVFCVYTTEEYKNFVTEMNRWYAEGLIDMELTRDEANFQALCATNTVGAFSHLSERETQYNNLLATSGYPEAVHSLIHHPAGTKEVQVVKRDPTWNHYAIPASSDKAELAVKWMNFVWGSDEGVTLTEWGIEGKTWEEVDGKKQYTDFVLNNPDGLDPYNALRSLGASNTILVRTPAESYVALNGQGNAIPYAESTNMIEPFPNMMSTAEEQDILDMYSTDFDTYCSESILSFITGATDLGEWQSFVDTLNNIGLEELRTVKQAQYDRSRGA